MKINEKIKAARINAGLTQEQMADKLGIKQPNYQIYENHTVPSIERLAEIAEICNVDIKYFLEK